MSETVHPGGLVRHSDSDQEEENRVDHHDTKEDDIESFDMLDDVNDDAEELSLTHMRLRYVPPSLTRFECLRTLCLRQNLISNMDGLESCAKLPLEELDLYDNRLSSISHLEPLNRTLKYNLDASYLSCRNLDISFNNIREIERLESLAGLNQLYLASNKISIIKNLSSLTQLTILELGANRIKDIEGLDSLVNLKQLWLGKNKITNISGLDALVNLEILSIQSNRLTRLSGLSTLTKLEELYVSHNLIEVIEGLENNLKLRVLDVSTNRISKLSNISHLSELEEFWANHNQITSFQDLDLLRNAAQLKTVYFEGNPLAENVQYRLKVKLALPSLIQIDANYTK